MSEEEKQFTEAYKSGYIDGLKDNLTPHEYRKEELYNKDLEDVMKFVRETLSKGGECSLNKILLSIEAQKDMDHTLKFSAKKAGLTELKLSTAISSTIILLIGAVGWYFYSYWIFIGSIIYTIAMIIGALVKYHKETNITT